jgi:hypothetical protein
MKSHESLGIYDSDTGKKKRNILVSLEHFRFNSRLVSLDAPNSHDLLPLRQKVGSCWVIGEQEDECEEHDKCHEGDDDEEPLPLSDLLWSGGCTRGGMICAKRDEPRNDGGEPVALECPADALSHFGAGVEHGNDERDSGCDAAFCHSQEDTKDGCCR